MSAIGHEAPAPRSEVASISRRRAIVVGAGTAATLAADGGLVAWGTGLIGADLRRDNDCRLPFKNSAAIRTKPFWPMA